MNVSVPPLVELFKVQIGRGKYNDKNVTFVKQMKELRWCLTLCISKLDSLVMISIRKACASRPWRADVEREEARKLLKVC